MNLPMRALQSTLAVLGLGSALIAVAMGGGCSSDEEETPATPSVVACTATRVPQNGEACDPNELGQYGYCRPGNCSDGCLDECRCKEGQWICQNSCRDAYGCGTAPKCMDLPCRPDGGGDLCPAVGSSCPSGCSDLAARRIDLDRGCVWAPETVQCSSPSTTCSSGTVCLARVSDDAAYWFTADCHREGWRPCTVEESAIAMDARVCTISETGVPDTFTPDTSASTDANADADANANADANADAPADANADANADAPADAPADTLLDVALDVPFDG